MVKIRISTLPKSRPPAPLPASAVTARDLPKLPDLPAGAWYELRTYPGKGGAVRRFLYARFKTETGKIGARNLGRLA